MKRKIITTALALLFATAGMAQDLRVAVFDPIGTVPSFIREIVREEISVVIVNTPGYIVLERAMINQVLEENRFQASGLVDDAQISEIGRMLGANLALVTNITQMTSGDFHISARLIDVLTARVVRQQTARTSRGDADLVDAIERMARAMFVGTVRTATTQPQQTATPATQTRPTNNIPYVFLADCMCYVQTSDARRGLEWVQVLQTAENILREEGVRIRATTIRPVGRAMSSFCPEGWRVPTIVELGYIYQNREKIGGFSTSNVYYSSTLNHVSQVLFFDFATGEARTIHLRRDGGFANLRCVRNR